MQLQLSNVEIQILAALLGYESVFCLDDKDIISRKAEGKEVIRQQMQYMEEKRLIRYELNGTLYMDPNIKKVLECLGEAETVAMFTDNFTQGKRVTTYVMVKNGTVVYLKPECGKVRIELSDSFIPEKLFRQGLTEDRVVPIHEVISLEEIQCIRERIEAFDFAKAQDILNGQLKSNGSVGLIERILSGKAGYMSGQIYKRGKLLYKLTGNVLLFVVDGYVVAVSADENREIHFDTVQPEAMKQWLAFQVDFPKK